MILIQVLINLVILSSIGMRKVNNYQVFTVQGEYHDNDDCSQTGLTSFVYSWILWLLVAMVDAYCLLNYIIMTIYLYSISWIIAKPTIQPNTLVSWESFHFMNNTTNKNLLTRERQIDRQRDRQRQTDR